MLSKKYYEVLAEILKGKIDEETNDKLVLFFKSDNPNFSRGKWDNKVKDLIK